MEIQGLGPNSPFRAPWDPEGVQYQVKVCVHHESNSGGPMGGSWDQIWPIGALRGPWGPPKGLFGAKSSPFKAPWGPEGARYQVKVCFDHEPNSGGPMGGSWDQIWPPRPSEDLRGPQKGLLEPKRALLGAIEVL